jgi:hypothetical protein
MMVGDILKYIPTSTVGKVADVKESRDGIVWIKLDVTGLYYDSAYLKTADPSEYIQISFKEREKSVSGHDGAEAALEKIRKDEEEVDIKFFTPSGGG